MTSLPPTLTSSSRPKRKRQRGRSLTVRRNATNARGNPYVLHRQGDLAIDSNGWWQRLAIFGGSAWALGLSAVIFGLALATLAWLNSSDGAATTGWEMVQGQSFWSGILSRWGLGWGIWQTAKHHFDEWPVRDCLIDEDATPALYPGDLNTLFEGIAANYSNHSASTFDIIATVHTHPNHSRGNFPWILTLDNFLLEEECDVLIKLGYDQGFHRSMDVEQSTKQRDKEPSHFGKITARRTSESAWCTTTSGCRDQNFPRRLHQRISDLLGIPKENSEDLQILKYNVGECMCGTLESLACLRCFDTGWYYSLTLLRRFLSSIQFTR